MENTNNVVNEEIKEDVKVDTAEVKTFTQEEVNEIMKPKEESKKFKSSEFISPIFGKDSNRTNDEFLKDLKDFRSNL